MSLFPVLLKFYKYLYRRSLYSFLTKEVLAISPNSRVLIVGAGGECESLIRKIATGKSIEFESIDIDSQRNPTIVGDIHHYPFLAHAFDVIIIPEVLEHLVDVVGND